MKKFWGGYFELLGDVLIILLGAILIYIFVTIEVLGYYAVESNALILWLEKYMGFPIIFIGVCLLIMDLKRRKK